MKSLDFEKLAKVNETKAIEEVKEELISDNKLEIEIKLNAVEMICLHPVNNTYPLLTLLLSSLTAKTTICQGVTEVALSI